ncbi:PD-(D/E)XK nuclease family protein [Nonlabens sp. Asnod2-A12]|uniref:PD-(D/E)XK nuclease family protein n=1 Tax=Nonlabens sp. Asnod2-A12 TaxID=3160578 RepID=UPI003870A98C
MIEKLEELNTFLNQHEIPLESDKVGFLEIIRKAHNETINSNIYSYFLNCNDTTIANVFLSSLLELIKEKCHKKLKFSGHYALTEFSTDEGRIDILIKDNFNPSTIIIENKIYHHLHNSLREYWNYIKVSEQEKVGVLLTLNPHAIPNEVKDEFINITHWEWVTRIKQELDFDEITKESNVVYLNDFFNSIEKLSTTYTMNQSAKFYFEHASKINMAQQTLHEGHNFMLEQYQLISSKLGLEQYGNQVEWKNFWDEENHMDTFFTVATHNLISGKGLSYQIIVEVIRKDLARVDEIKKEFSNHLQFKDKNSGELNSNYHHLLVKTYSITVEELGSFADHALRNIRKDFGEIFIALIEYLYSDIPIERWKENLSIK